VGKLIYGSSSRELELDDRMLAHVKSIAVMKLRRNESFTISWPRSLETGGGRVTIWVHPSISLQFEFDQEQRPELNRSWLESMMQDANKTGDLAIGREVPDIDQRARPTNVSEPRPRKSSA
jgi:hypothetical protein